MSHSKTTKIVAGFLGLTMAVTLLVGVGVQTASAQSASLKDLVELFISLGIIAPDKAVQARAAVSGGTVPSIGGGYTFTRNLTVGSSGQDVQELQKFLNGNGYTVAVSGAGSAGKESTRFGPATKAALAKFQAAKSISPAVGYFGPLTRQTVNGMTGTTGGTTSGGTIPTTGGGTTTPVPAGTGLSVSSIEQPVGALAPQSGARIPFTKFVLTAGNDGDIVVNSVTVERTGQAADGAFAGVVLLDENGAQLGIAKTFNSNHQAIVGEAFTVKKGTSKTMTLAGNMAADNSTRGGQVASLTVVAVNTSAAVAGSLPITGASHTINSTLTIGSVTTERGPLDPNAAQTKNVGATGYTFSSIKVTAGSTEDVRIHSIRWNQASSAGASDLANIVTIVAGQEYPTTLSADGKFYSSTFPGGILVEKGLSKEISIKGDIIGGSGRTVAFNVEKTTDIYITGELYKYGITPPTSGTGFTAGTIWYPGKTVTIDTGSMTVERATSVVSQYVAPNLSNQPLGGFTVEVKGEPITVASMTFNVATTGSPTTGGSNQLLTNVTIVDNNGTVVAGPVDATFSAAATQRLTFSDTVLFPVGKNTYTLKGKIGSNFAADGTLIVTVTPGSATAPNFSTVTGQVTGKTITASTGAVTLSTMTVKGAALSISVSTDPAAQTVVAGAQNFTFANYQLSALSSGEDVSMTSLPLDYTTTGTATDLTNCSLYDGAVALNSGTNAVNPSAASDSLNFTFDKPYTIPKGTLKTLAVKCNIASGATGGHQWGYNSSSSPSATGMTSGQSVTVTENTSAGQLMTLTAGGSIDVTLDSSSPSYTLGAAGTTGNTVSVLRIRASNEAIKLTDLEVRLPNSASSSPTDVSKVSLYDGSSKIGEAVFQAGNYSASTTIGTCTGCSELIIPKDTDKIITVKADFAAQGISSPGVPGTLVAVDWNNASGDATKGIGQSSGTTIKRTNGTSTSSSGVRVFKSYPTLALVDLPATKLTAGRAKLMRFKITAAPQGDVGVYKLTFHLSTTSATQLVGMINNLNVYVYEDSGYTKPISGIQTDGAMLDNNIDLVTGTSTSGTSGKYHQPWINSTTDIEVWAMNSSAASTTVAIPAGLTRYFELQGDVTLSGSTYSVSSQLQGDAKFVSNLVNRPYNSTTAASSTYLASIGAVQGGTDGADVIDSTYGTALKYLERNGSTITTAMSGESLINNDFIWRPFSTTTGQSALANDYTNGYGIPGLPTSNTNTQSLSQ